MARIKVHAFWGTTQSSLIPVAEVMMILEDGRPKVLSHERFGHMHLKTRLGRPV